MCFTLPARETNAGTEELDYSPELFGFNSGEDAELYTILNKPTLPLYTALF